MKKTTKIITFYLPQFHEIPENNQWWGQGFTEWKSVREAKKIDPDQYQPKTPYKGNYYNLLNKRTMLWQSKLAQSAGIYGFCFYHYWFKGKKLLEKPIENYLEWTDIPQKYCLSWANESWIRTWSSVAGNDWNEVYDKNNRSNNGPSVLVQQDYGNKEDWAAHFYYLLSFFKDNRYIYIDNKPVFLLYKPDTIPCLTAMLKYWNELAVENGLLGIYIIATNTKNVKQRYINAMVMYEPNYTLTQDIPQRYIVRNKIRERLVKHGVTIDKKYNYDSIWKKIINRKIESSKKIYLGGFVNYDDTSRRGKNGTFFRGVEAVKFKRYLEKLIKKSHEELNNNFIFLTAWNEWSEGAYLEPDEKNGYAYLSAIKGAIDNYKDR